MDKQIYSKLREVEDDHWWFVGRRSIVKRVLGLLDLPRMPSVLDAGCGTGGTLPMLSGLGKVVGLELDDGAAQVAITRHAGKLCRGGLPHDMPFSEQTFDLIVLLDVLEHIDDDLSAMMTVKNLLRPNGYLILTVPAFPFLWSQHDEGSHHKRRYQASSLARLIQEAGLQAEYITFFNTLLFPAATLVRLARRLIPPNEIASDLRLPRPWLNKLLQAIFSSERHFMGWARLPFGVSLLAIVRRT